jgi:hypothetical protein
VSEPTRSRHGQTWELDHDLIDDELWDYARGRRGDALRQVRDPLAERIRQIRRERRVPAVDPNGPEGQRQRRAERSRERCEGSRTASERSALARHRADLQRLRERLAAAPSVE